MEASFLSCPLLTDQDSSAVTPDCRRPMQVSRQYQPEMPEESLGSSDPVLPYSPFATLLLGLAIAGVFTLMQIYAMFTHAWALMDLYPALLLSEGLARAQGDGRALALAMLSSSTAGVALILIVIRSKIPRLPIAEYLALKVAPTRDYIRWMMAFVALLWAVQVLMRLFAQPLDATFLDKEYHATSQPWIIWLPVVFTIPVFEELFFRGFLFAGLARARWGRTGAIALTATAWALMHVQQYSPPAIMMVFGLGLILGCARAQTRSLLPPLAIHIVNNILALAQTATSPAG
jgi:membrane protease YdiL (CAAX protease family)